MASVIYHYTSNDVLLKILEGESLRLSARHHLNDSMEGQQFFSLLKSHPSSPDQKILDSIRTHLDSVEAFVTCFCSEGDLLSQWRGYAGNGTGVSIGFSRDSIVDAISGSHAALLYTVAYANCMSDMPQDRARTINDILSNTGTPSIDAVHTFAKERWAIKPKGFSEEKESRLIVTVDSRNGALTPSASWLQVGYMAVGSEVREYCDFSFDVKKLVKKITLGPNNRTDESVLARYLSRIGLGPVLNQASQTKVHAR